MGKICAMQPTLARTLWQAIEPIHAVTYFAPESRQAMREVGLRGFWMGYFASRAAPLGSAPAAVVEATFSNFHPAHVRRAIPDAWGFASPERILAARAAAAAAALRRLAPAVDQTADRLGEELLPRLRAVLDATSGGGRPLFAANRDLPVDADPVRALWQAATTLREHRGDGHVAVLTAEGVHGCQAHVLFAAGEGIAPDIFRDNRGWSPADWTDAARRLVGRGLLRRSGQLTDAGRELRARIERRTDELALAPCQALGAQAAAALVAATRPISEAVIAAGVVPFPNPIGLPNPTDPV